MDATRGISPGFSVPLYTTPSYVGQSRSYECSCAQNARSTAYCNDEHTHAHSHSHAHAHTVAFESPVQSLGCPTGRSLVTPH